MKNLVSVVALFIVFAACREKLEDVPSCADLRVEITQLLPIWSTPFKDHVEPIVFEDKVLIVGPLAISGGENAELSCFNGSTGELLWQKTLSAYLLGDDVHLLGSKLYYTDWKSKTFRAFDLNALEDQVVCTLNSDVYLSRHFALGDGYAIILANEYLPALDSTGISAYLVDLQTGAFRRTLNFRMKYSFNGEVVFDPVTEIIPNGDTLFCFMAYELLTPSYETTHKFVCQNVGNNTVISTPKHQSFYSNNNGNLILENGKAYFSLDDSVFCLDAATTTPIWKKRIAENYYNGLTLKDGFLFIYESNRFLDAIDPVNGKSHWNSGLNIGSVESLRSSFVDSGQLYFIEDFHLSSIDLETGCRISKQAAPSGKNLLSDLALSADRKTVYLSDYYSLFGITILE